MLRHLHKQVNTSAKRVAYSGAAHNMVMALAELAHGGQILMDEASFDGIKGQLLQLRSEVASGPDLDALQVQCRHGPQLLSLCACSTSMHAQGEGPAKCCTSLVIWRILLEKNTLT